MAEIFSGNSRYASDFQTVINRSVAIASLPLQQLSNNKLVLQDQSTALTGLDNKFASLQSALGSIESATGLSSYSSSVSNGSVVKANISSGAMEGTYTVEVTSLGSFSNTMSRDGLPVVADPSQTSLSSDSTFTLSVNGTDYSITPSGNNLTALAQAINDKAGSSVQASIVNVGSSSTPDYRLSIQSKELGADSIQLSDGSGTLLDTLATGAKAAYKINGLSTQIESTSRTITLAPGVTINLLQKSADGDPTTITVSRSTTAIQSALTAFANAYNSAVDELNKHRGPDSGVLSGDSLINSLSSSLRELSSYSGGPKDIPSIVDLGLSFDQGGKMSLDTSKFSALSPEVVMEFLGSEDTGGFLQIAGSVLDSVENSSTGVLKNEINSVQGQMDRQDDLIAENQDRIDQLTESLNAQMAAADALIASLEQQVNYMNSLFESMRINAEGMR